MRNRLSDIQLARMRYHVITGDLARHPSFQYWKAHWPSLVQALGSDEQLPDSEFLKQQKATLIMNGDEIVGLHLLSRYDEKDLVWHPYFKEYDATFIRHLQTRGIKRVQSLQYFIVDEAYAVNRTLVNFGAIIASLSLKHQALDHLDASVTLARSDIPVTSLGLKIGFEQISTRTMHNVPVSMLACFNPQPYPKDDVNKWVNFFWERRIEQSITEKRLAG